MNDIPRQKLIELLAQYGPSLISDRQKCIGLLWDFCGAYKKELNILKMTLEYGVPDGLQSMIVKPTALPKEIFLARLEKHLMDNLAMTEEAAQWTVETWALALKYVTPNELAGSKKPIIPPPPVKLPNPLPISTPNGPVLIVSRLGMGQFKSISEAILAAAPGTKIIVKPGLYKEILTIDKPLEIVGDGQMEEIVVENNPPLTLLSGQVKIQNIEMRGKIDLKKGVLILESCHLKGGITIQGDTTLLQIKKSKISSISNSARDESKIVVEDSEVQTVGLSGSNFSLFQKTTIFAMSIGKPYNTIPAGVDFEKTPPYFDLCKILVLEIREGKPQFINCIFTGNDIRRSRSDGIKCATISQNGAGIFVNCDFSGHRADYVENTPAISIEGKGISEFRKCKIHSPLPPEYSRQDGKATGICFGEDAEGIMEDCEIYTNEIGVEIKRGANPIIRKCMIGQNKSIGIWVHDNGAGLVEDCNLKNNGQTWKIEPGCPVQRMNNVE